IAVMRGPIVYCLEKQDVATDVNIFDLKMKQAEHFTPRHEYILGQDIVLLEGNAYRTSNAKWDSLYRRASNNNQEAIPVRLVPYFAWGNRTFGDMAVWLPVF